MECTQPQIHTGFHRFTGIGKIFHNKYIFIKKASKLKSRDEIIRQFSSLHLRRMELANILSHMIQKPRKGDFREIKSKKFPGGACPQTSLEACTFTTHLENWSVFILDWCLVFLNRLCWVPF